MSGHTPGPWMAADQPTNGRLPIVSQANGRSVGAVSWLGAMPDGFKSHEQECHANARLIAAAPELLDAITALVHGFESYQTVDPLLADARAAIAKAGGANAPIVET